MPYVRLIQPDEAKGRAIPARYAVTGAVTVTGNATHVDARVVETADGKVLGSTSFDAPPGQPDVMRDEILGAIGDDLSVAINRLRFPGPPPTPQTVRAREMATEARDMTDRHAEEARAGELFEQARNLSPNDPDIAGWQANYFITAAVLSDRAPDQKQHYFDRARAVIAQYADISALHRLLGYANCQLANYSGHPDAAVNACGTMRLILPWSARVYKEIGAAYLSLGLPAEALAAYEQAERLNQRSIVRWTWEFKAGIASLLLGRDADAARWLRAAVALHGNEPGIHGLLALACERTGDTAGVAREIAALRQFGDRPALQHGLSESLDPYRFSDPALQARLEAMRHDVLSLADN
jgi:tetratricopeptide (TPR) repeat protein